MNDAQIILADEPTGALDSQSGKDVLALLTQLHQQGKTVIIITHDAEVASHAQRLVEMRDGQIIRDTAAATTTSNDSAITAIPATSPLLAADHPFASSLADAGEAIRMALRALRANVFRTVLTLLGIVIGVASVVVMLAVGNGARAHQFPGHSSATGSPGRTKYAPLTGWLNQYPDAPRRRTGRPAGQRNRLGARDERPGHVARWQYRLPDADNGHQP